MSWLCIVAYFWAATGIAEAAQLDTVISQHSQSSVIVDSSSDARLVIHHVGHRDAHEPHSVDSNDRLVAPINVTGVPHVDHVINLNCSQEFSGLTAKDVKAPQLLALAAKSDSVMSCWAASCPSMPTRPIALQIRNSNTASIKLTRLRI